MTVPLEIVKLVSEYIWPWNDGYMRADIRAQLIEIKEYIEGILVEVEKERKKESDDQTG